MRRTLIGMVTLAQLAIASPLLAIGPDGYLTGPDCALGQPVGAGVSLPPPVTLSDLEHRIGEALDRTFRHPDQLKVKPVPEPDAPLSAGKFRRVEVEFTGGALDILPVVKARFIFENVSLDLPLLYQKGELHLTGKTPVEARLITDEAGINQALMRRAKKLKVEDPRITLRHGAVQFSGKIKTFVIKNRIATDGAFQVQPVGKICFIPRRLSVGVMPVPHSIVSSLAHKINPVVEISHLRGLGDLTLNVTRIAVANHQLVIETDGATHWPR
jgi:hypothetical protein